jgi:hypothetical protein
MLGVLAMAKAKAAGAPHAPQNRSLAVTGAPHCPQLTSPSPRPQLTPPR